MSVSREQHESGILLPFKTSKNFTALWLGQSLASIGASILNVVLPLIALSMHASTVTLGIIMTLLMLPQVILLPFAGILADLLPRVPMMILTDSVRFLLLLVMTLLAATHHLHLDDVYVFAVVFGAMQALFQPAYAAARAQVFAPSIRSAANSLTFGMQ